MWIMWIMMHLSLLGRSVPLAAFSMMEFVWPQPQENALLQCNVSWKTIIGEFG